MAKQVIRTDKAPQAIGPYSQGIELNGWLFLSGQIPLNPETGELLASSIQEETHQVFRNIEGVLSSSGLSLEHVVKATVFLVDMADFSAVNEVYAQYFHTNPPARSCVAVKALPKGARVEIEVIASRV